MSVAELLARYPGEHPSREPQDNRSEPALGPTPSRPGIDDTDQMFVTDLLRREGRPEELPPPARPAWVYQWGALAAGLILILGALAAGAATLSGPRTERAAPLSAGPATMTGAKALRPDLINASVQFPPQAAGQPHPQARSAPPGPAAVAHSTAAAPRTDPEVRRPGQQQPSTTTRPAPSTVAGDRIPDEQLGPILGTVTDFYRSVTVEPQKAFSLLDSQMRGTGYSEFLDAWAGIERVTVDEIHPDGPNTALVITSLEERDGTVLHTVQNVLVIPGTAPRITDARLLSASRS